MIKFLVTMAATVVLDLTQAIVIGVAVSVILILIKLTDIEINISEIDSERLEEAGIHLPRISGKVRVAYLSLIHISQESGLRQDDAAVRR